MTQFGSVEQIHQGLGEVRGNRTLVVQKAKDMARKAYQNLEKRLKQDYKKKGVKPSDRNEANQFLEHARQECDELAQSLITQYMASAPQQNQPEYKTYYGEATSPLAALCGCAMLEDISMFVNITPASLDPSTWTGGVNEKLENKYCLRLDNAIERKLVLPAIIQEYLHNPHGSFSTTV